ncbi:MAG: SlyX family protein [Treponema sp.]|nr:SlyX family protein [Treponema sp.]
MENETDSKFEERFINIETKLAYMEDFVNQIQQVAVEQAKEIALLRKENKLMIEKIKEMAENQEGDIPNRKPPHY